MPRVTFVQAARKDNPVAKKGESYYWWKFRFGGKHYSLTRPQPSQLTQSAYYSSIRMLSESVNDWFADSHEPEHVSDFACDIATQLTDITSECQDSLDNMPEQLQYAPTGELLQERIDMCEGAASEIECMDFDFESELDDDADEDEIQEELNDWLMELESEIIEQIDQCEV